MLENIYLLYVMQIKSSSWPYDCDVDSQHVFSSVAWSFQLPQEVESQWYLGWELMASTCCV